MVTKAKVDKKDPSSAKASEGKGKIEDEKKITKSIIQDSETQKELAKSKPSIIHLVDSLILDAYKNRASDVHLDPEPSDLRVRLRIDGILHEAFTFPKEIHSEVLSRIKVLSGLRTDEHQAAQDGRFKLTFDKVDVDVRVSIAPTFYGENAVMRLLAEQAEAFTLEGLGFIDNDLVKIQKAIKKPYGMILVTGPTGSGKTTTLYTILKMLNTSEVSIITIEDPIEYSITGIEQIQVNSRTGITFASGLRSILRQDPNVIMVGEIRDEETASIAVNAALTGHLLLSTLHTNDAPTTLPRLLDMKIEPFLIASTVNIAVGQRLVRMICKDCKTKKTITDAELKSLSDILPPNVIGKNREFYYGKGCAKCDNSGYRSRVGIHEVLDIDNDIREAIVRHADASEIKKIAIKNGMTTMLEDGYKKAAAGVTTIEEILRVIHE
ncbi:MAG: type IV pilus assembly protein PilB [Parcubacteria group bacterium Gr01-1014_3]|nr:MAG: type IV pilus assembly protein PilB [Parcubacteria group bacterium Gr01-1014_3]